MSGRRDDDDLDARLEQSLADLFDARDPGPAPRTLRARVDRVPERTPLPRSRRERLTSSFVAVAGIAAAILLAVVLGPLLGTRVQGPVASLLPSAPVVSPGASPIGTIPPDAPFDYPEIRPWWGDNGVGPDVLVLLLVGATVCLILLGIRSLRRHDAAANPSRLDAFTPGHQAIAWLAIAGALVAYILVGQPLTASINGWGGMYVIGDPGERAEVLAPHPGQVSTIEGSFINTSLVPVTITGVAPWPSSGYGQPIQPDRIISMRIEPDTAMAIPAPGPFTVWPGQSVYLRIAYRHLPCEAWGVPVQPQSTPWPTPGPDASFAPIPDGTSITSQSTIPLRVTILGIPRTLEVQSDFNVGTAVPTACPPTEPLAPADLSVVPADLSLANAGPTVFTDDTISPPGPDLAGWVIAILVAASLGLVGVIVRRRQGSRSSFVAAGLIVVIAGATIAWTVQPPTLEAGPTGLGGQGLVAGSDTPGIEDIADIGPGGVFTFSFTLKNTDPLPVTLVGVHDSAGQVRVTGLGRPWNAGLTPGLQVDPENAIMLYPFTDVAPGASMQVLAKGTVGACARRLAEDHDAWVMLTGIPWTVERLGRRYTTMVPLPSPVRVPADAACLATATMAADGREAWYPVQSTGTVTDVGPTPVEIAVVGGIVLLGILAVVLYRRRGRRAAALPLAGMTVLAAWVALAQLVPVSMLVSAAANGDGTVASQGSMFGPRLYVVTAAPGQPHTQTFWLHSTSLFPIEVTGVMTSPGQRPWTGLWRTAPDTSAFTPPVGAFAPVPLGRDDAGFWLVGRAPACAYAGFDPAGPMPSEPLAFEAVRVRLAVTVIGFPRTVDLPEQYWPTQPIKTSDQCAGSTSGG